MIHRGLAQRSSLGPALGICRMIQKGQESELHPRHPVIHSATNSRTSIVGTYRNGHTQRLSLRGAELWARDRYKWIPDNSYPEKKKWIVNFISQGQSRQRRTLVCMLRRPQSFSYPGFFHFAIRLTTTPHTSVECQEKMSKVETHFASA